jgi:uncharacterized protein YjbJ (UPF0337 family)
MNWDRIQGNWKQVPGKTEEQWGKLTGNGVDDVAGRHELLAWQIQERYGVAIAEAEKRRANAVQAASGSWFQGSK